jgi:hypothetical protein
MRTRSKATITELRVAIECLPRDTRIAMLGGIRSNPIIAGAYATRDGICPMLAAHRAGGRTSCIAFAKAWDRFAFRGARARVARRATERELRVLSAHLEASLLEDDPPLSTAIAEHQAAIAEHQATITEHQRLADSRPNPERPGDRDRGPEFEHRPGWSWMRAVRRYDEYQRALERLQAQCGSDSLARLEANAGPGSSDQPERQPTAV